MYDIQYSFRLYSLKRLQGYPTGKVPRSFVVAYGLSRVHDYQGLVH